MRTTLRSLPLLCALLATPGLAGPVSPAPGAQPAPAQPAPSQEGDRTPGIDLSRVEIPREIDRSMRWLRERQEEDGSYGGSVVDTAWVLRAFALSPRTYGRIDGPFVSRALDYLAARQDSEGYVHDEDADPDQVQAQTVLAYLGVEPYSDPQSRVLAARMAEPFGGTLAVPEPPVPSLEEARELAQDLLERRRPDGSWTGSEGALVETARAVVELSRVAPVLRPAAAEPAPPSLLPPFDAADRATALAAMERGASFLAGAAGPDGRFGAQGRPDAGITAMAVGALLALPEPRPEEVQEVIDKNLAWLASLQDRDGSIHDGKLKNYITSAAVMALARAGREEHRPVIQRARDFLLALQADESEGYSEGDLYYGGIGYGSGERPDLSNLQMALEALTAAGVEPGDPAFERALKFLERTQNRSESNPLEIERGGQVIVSGDDGGAAYLPGQSMAGMLELPDGRQVPRSYGSMTYALLKGFLLVGLPRDDPRMEAAWQWIRANYSLDVNPGFEHSPDPTAGYQGLYYYFLAMARALDLYGEEVIVGPEGEEHEWRRELSGRLVAMQRRDDGAWVNENSPRWWEGDPVLATSYALLALEAALPQPEGAPEPADDSAGR